MWVNIKTLCIDFEKLYNNIDLDLNDQALFNDRELRFVIWLSEYKHELLINLNPVSGSEHKMGIILSQFIIKCIFMPGRDGTGPLGMGPCGKEGCKCQKKAGQSGRAAVEKTTRKAACKDEAR